MRRFFSGEFADLIRFGLRNTFFPSRRPGVAAMIFAVLWLAVPQVTQSAPAGEPPPSTMAKYRHVVQACAAEAARFCSLDEQSSHLGRDQTYCLKPHRPDLSLSCRGAVNTALR